MNRHKERLVEELDRRHAEGPKRGPSEPPRKVRLVQTGTGTFRAELDESARHR